MKINDYITEEDENKQSRNDENWNLKLILVKSELNVKWFMFRNFRIKVSWTTNLKTESIQEAKTKNFNFKLESILELKSIILKNIQANKINYILL